MIIQTERLILRELANKDKHDLYTLFNEDFAFTYEAHLPKEDIADVAKYIEFHMANAISPNRTHYYFAIELQEDREFVGMIGFSFCENITINGVSGPLMELEYYLLEANWNKGYMTEALRAIVAFAFDKTNTVKIFAQCHVENVKSEKVMIKCGMCKSLEQPKPKLYNGVPKVNVRYELTADTYGRSQVIA